MVKASNRHRDWPFFVVLSECVFCTTYMFPLFAVPFSSYMAWWECFLPMLVFFRKLNFDSDEMKAEFALKQQAEGKPPVALLL